MNVYDNKFHKMTPIRNADLGIYCDALDFVFLNDDLRNIAISGAYSAGKSSVLESYKVKHKEKRFLHISLAHFEDTSKEPTSQLKRQNDLKQDEIKESVIEGKILNQLIHQISPSKIPQTNFRIKQNVSYKKVWVCTIATVVFFLFLFHIIFFDIWQSYNRSITTDWIKSLLSITINNSSILFTGTICIIFFSIMIFNIINAQINKGILKKISTNKFEIELFKGNEDSYFDKYLSEVRYLFEQCEADVIVFEDMDRYNVIHIFERLREVNTLINLQRHNGESKKLLRFFYLLRDDIFVSKDRTKFFDFIIPIVPVVDSSNSYDQFVEQLTVSSVFKFFDESFLQGLSLYIDDMRILKNICNEFVIYNSLLNTTELNPNKLISIITYKNLFPQDFNDLQLGRGFIASLFEEKEHYISKKIDQLQIELSFTKDHLEAVKNECLVSVQELAIVIADKKKSVANKRLSNTYTSQQKDAELKQLIEEETRRKLYIQDKSQALSQEIINNIQRIEKQLSKVKSESLKEIITRENINDIFAITRENEIGIVEDFKTVRGNTYFALLKYLIRNGYIDETYSDYITYFYEHSLSKTDKIFLRSITDQIKKEPNYQIKEPKKVFARLDVNFFQRTRSSKLRLALIPSSRMRLLL